MKLVALATIALMFTGAVQGEDRPVSYVLHHRACAPADNTQPRPSIAVGCDVLNPALGCGASSPLTLQLDLKGPAGARVELNVSNASPELLARLAAGGEAKLRGSIIRLGPGKSTITGFVGSSAPIPLLTAKILKSDVPPQLSEGRREVRLEIEQFAGPTSVGKASISDIFHACTAARTSGDHITQTGFGSARDSIVLVQGRRSSGCTSWPEIYTGAEDVFMDNLLKKDTCSSRAAIFSDSHAMAYRLGLTNWTDGANDRLLMPPAPVVKERVKLWHLYNMCRAGSEDCTSAQDTALVDKWPETELEVATEILRSQFGGIAFEKLGVTNLTHGQNAETTALVQAALAAKGCGDSVANEPLSPTEQTLNALHAITGDTPSNQLNVFYVEDPGAGGIWCVKNDPDGRGRNTILIASYHDPRELAHEIGHALLDFGGHVEDVPGFTATMIDDNLMKTGDLGSSLTIGQLFRANVESNGSINRHGLRNGPTTSCAGAGGGTSCPPLNFDVPRP